MFLKQLETIGFKSFAERTKIQFVPGVTAVVGPNGSGKSNIIDAVRWVLGEQSARSLRGQKMEDIIFQGSDTRNPLHFAEVSLILNNESGELPITYEEVNITRRVYRSGESEFFMNKQPCRLKDIVDLFIDTGLGRDSFSIIGQGKIDEILSSKAEERRAIFEEAAGVLKYKQRKLEAQFKLSETADNLSRVEDIVHEIEKQLTPLKEQVEVAKRYKRKRSELEKLEVAILVTEIEQLHVKWKTLLKQLEDEKMKEIEQRTYIQTKQAEIEQKRKTMYKFEEEISDLQETLLQLTEKIEHEEGERRVLRERLTHLSENKAKLVSDQEEVQHRLATTNKEIETKEIELASVNESLQRVHESIRKEKEKRHDTIESLQEKIEHVKAEYIELLNEQAAYQNERSMLERQIERAEAELSSGTHASSNVIEQEKKAKEEYEQLKKQIHTLRSKLKREEENIVSLKNKLEYHEKKYQSMQTRLYEGNEQIATLVSRRDMLQDLKENYQGFFHGVKEVLKAKQANMLTEIYGAVVDLITVPNDYMTAIDTVLGAQAQHVVVRNESAAREAIAWLKKRNVGRATFLPLDAIEQRNIPSSVVNSLKRQNGFIGIANELVTVEDEFKAVTDHLLGNVIVTENLVRANEIARRTNRRYRVVTLDGDIVFPGGSMSGGAKRKGNEALFTREREIDELTEKITQFTERRDNFIRKIEEQEQTMDKIKGTIEEKSIAVTTVSDTLKDTEKAYREAELNLRSVLDEMESSRLQEQQVADELAQLREEKATVAHKINSLSEKIATAEATVARLQEEETNWVEKKKAIDEKVHQLEIEQAEQKARQHNIQAQIDTLRNEMNTYEENLHNLREQLDQLQSLEERQRVEGQLDERIELYTKKRTETRDRLEQLRTDRKQLAQSLEDEERELKQIEKAYDAFVQRIQEKEVQANRMDVTLDNYLTTLQEEYTITFERAKERYGDVEHLQEVKERVQTLKSDIKRLGTVNLGAIEEYERLQERYTFLIEQRDDLVEAKETLYKVIEEMDEEMTVRFSEIFAEIQVAFTDVFKQLFGGGHAELQLTDPTEMLETGIDIVARPPGKKLKNLSLLSGGERALTAIALLFAILKARPVPFCILDEVDAALDEANVARFGEYLKSFSESTQFIVITHRKGTMEEVDALYGVTMQESGVSRLVSVRLEDAERYVHAK